MAKEKKITRNNVRSIFTDPEKSAAAVRLRYVSDAEPGIHRIRKKQKFYYVRNNKVIKDEKLLERIRALVIPPAWENVWICAHANGHLQVTGIDMRGRKQYKYHPLWNTVRNHTKFYRLYDFGKAMPLVRKKLESDLALKGLPLKKVLATVVSLMERTSIRIGSNLYEKLYGSYGLTTLKDQHVKISGSDIRFMFRGKKGISQNITLKSKKLAAIVKQCRDIPGKELFQYFDEAGKRHCIDSGMVNAYLKEISGSDFTAKDFRTWAGSLLALTALSEEGVAENATVLKKKVIAALDQVAEHLGNTRTVCRKYYVHPAVISLYENNSLEFYTNQIKNMQKCGRFDLACEEKILMRILEKETLRLSA